MTIQPIEEHQWPQFLALIARQGWIISHAEVQLYRQLNDTLLLGLYHRRQALGFISACVQQQRAWIGNLIVDPAVRGRGYGACLFDHLLEKLIDRGCHELWLTASAAGQPLYERRGFVARDHIQRWQASGLGTSAPTRRHYPFLCQCDRRVQHVQRRRFLRILSHNNPIVRSASSVALLQTGTTITSLGPWYDLGADPCHQLACLMLARQVCSRQHPLVTDIFASAQLQRPLCAAGFSKQGETTLMLRSEKRTASQHRPHQQLALSGLGSFN